MRAVKTMYTLFCFRRIWSTVFDSIDLHGSAFIWLVPVQNYSCIMRAVPGSFESWWPAGNWQRRIYTYLISDLSWAKIPLLTKYLSSDFDLKYTYDFFSAHAWKNESNFTDSHHMHESRSRVAGTKMLFSLSGSSDSDRGCAEIRVRDSEVWGIDFIHAIRKEPQLKVNLKTVGSSIDT